MKKIFLAIMFIASLVLAGCAMPQAKENPTIGEILARPRLYENKTVVIDGKYGGWSGKLTCDYGNMAMKTRSDVIIYDATGCLYLNGHVEIIFQENPLDPGVDDNIGKSLKVKAVVKLLDGKPYLGD